MWPTLFVALIVCGCSNLLYLLLIAHPAHNSLPAALEILAQVQQENGSGRIYLLKGKDDAATAPARRRVDQAEATGGTQ